MYPCEFDLVDHAWEHSIFADKCVIKFDIKQFGTKLWQLNFDSTISRVS